jgi:murein DD-endopeptidase MepM/ murein hydrolase activator NlpD
VPLDTVPWTDKVYPYGSTRGGTLQPHHGVEFAVGSGTPVLAAGPGTVVFAGDDLTTVVGPATDFYGNVVVIDHGPAGAGAVYTLYGHLAEVDVVAGESVVAGQPIGLSGDSGVAYGPHLHFEVRVGANRYDVTRNPLLWLVPLGGTGVVAGRVTWPDGAAAVETPLVLRRVDGSAPYTATTSYAAAGLNADATCGENFVVDDVVPGYYEIQAGDSGPTAELWVYPGRLTLIDLVLQP